MPKLTERQFYCVVCRKRKTAKAEDITVEYDRRDKARMVGLDNYGHDMYKYVKKTDVQKLANKYN
jgi:hypothetical protein